MKKLLMLLVVLIATPVFALSIGMTDNLDGTVTIGYSDANAANLPRAFALELTIEAPAVITAIGSYKLDGESTSGSKGFGIYPARIVIDANGDVDDYGSPLADPCDPGAGDGSSVVVLEFGSLYVGAANAPATSGTLVTLTIDCNEGADIDLTMVDEDTYRGGVLLEDGTPVAVDKTIQLCAGGCFPGGPGDPLYDEWVSVGSPDCWCASIQPRQCHGDADGTAETKATSWVYTNDLTVLKAAWGKNYATLAGQSAGTPSVLQICADFDHAVETKALSRVYTNDLTILKANWGLANKPDPNCATLGY